MSEESPVITRLKQFMQYIGMTNSQFADTASIPRPTLSQLLHGRNKSVSDQLLRKLHDSFPSLNIAWLLFGKGDMLTDGNIEISEGLFDGKQDENMLQYPDNMGETIGLNSIEDSLDNSSNRQNPPFSAQPAIPRTQVQSPQTFKSNSAVPDSILDSMTAAQNKDQDLSSETVPEKKIKSIIVFYTDSSFEVFSPSE